MEVLIMAEQAVNFAAFVGIDWADEQHEVCVLAANALAPDEHSLKQEPEAIDEWATKLRQHFGGRPVAVCLEQSRGALIYALQKYEFLVLFPINPKQLARYREALVPSGAKNDPVDARRLAEFVRSFHNQMRSWRPDDETTRSLRLLTESRRKLVDQRTAVGQQLRQSLKEFFPLALCLLGDQRLHAPWFLKLLGRFRTLAELQRASPRTLERYLPHRRMTVDDPGDPRITQIRQARPLVTDPALLLAGRMTVQSLVPLLAQLNQAVQKYEAEIEALMASHPDAAIVQSFPGAADALAPRLIAALGTDRERLSDAGELQELCGIAPITLQSGKTRHVRHRYACSKFLRQTFHELADHSRNGSAWARAFYDMRRKEGHRHHAILRALAFKWIRIIFRCWKDRTLYSEQKYLEQLRKQNSPILKLISVTT
jgi:transposase